MLTLGVENRKTEPKDCKPVYYYILKLNLKVDRGSQVLGNAKKNTSTRSAVRLPPQSYKPNITYEVKYESIRCGDTGL